MMFQAKIATEMQISKSFEAFFYLKNWNVVYEKKLKQKVFI